MKKYRVIKISGEIFGYYDNIIQAKTAHDICKKQEKCHIQRLNRDDKYETVKIWR